MKPSSIADDRKVVMIGMDAAEVSLVERWMDEGRLPNLARLRKRGAFGRLDSPADIYNASAWPTFVTGVGPERHGIYNYLLWDPGTLAYDRPGPALPGIEPFWREASGNGIRTLALDVPYVYPADRFEGVELHGWAGHYKLVPPFSLPAARLDDLYARFGTPPIEGYGPGHLPAKRYLALRDEYVEATRAATRLVTTLMQEESFDLVVATLSSTHGGGHQFWARTNVRGRMSEAQRQALDGALGRIYEESDRAIGEIIRAAGPDAVCMVFALHGMGDNPSLAAILPEMLNRVMAGGPPADGGSGGPGWIGRLRNAVPVEWRSAVKRRLPASLQDRLTLFWKGSPRDWSGTRVFCLLPDREGFIQVNLKGREAEGVVEPGDEYETLCTLLQEELPTFVDADTGKPVIHRVARSEELLPGMAAEVRKRIPDLVVYWAEQASARVRAVAAPRYGEVAWPRPGVAVDGQSGHHRGTGWLSVTGPGIPRGARIEGGSAADLPATALALLGQEVPGHFAGRPLDLLIGGAAS